METLIAILFYIGALQPGQTYTQDQILEAERSFEPTIEEVSNNEVELHQAFEIYQTSGDKVIVLVEPDGL